eukprot:scaffold135464_cov23-Tisochrysis_lutea.AAC.1
MALEASEASKGEAGGAKGQGQSPSLHCPLELPSWPSRRTCRSSQRPEGRGRGGPWRAQAARDVLRAAKTQKATKNLTDTFRTKKDKKCESFHKSAGKQQPTTGNRDSCDRAARIRERKTTKREKRPREPPRMDRQNK